MTKVVRVTTWDSVERKRVLSIMEAEYTSKKENLPKFLLDEILLALKQGNFVELEERLWKHV